MDMDCQLNFQGKVALITGAGSGIGAATATLLYKLGANISITDINAEGLKNTHEECLKVASGQKQPFMINGDIADEKFQKLYVDESVKHFEKIDIYVNNAGIGPGDSLKSSSLETFDKVIKTNLRPAYNLISLTAPHLKETKGCIIIMSSCITHKPGMPYMLSYCLSKSALDQLTHMAASELGGDGIRVNSINPGPVKTNLYKQTCPDGNLDALCAAMAAKTTINKVGEPMDIAKLIAFVASDNARYITGANILIDGGMCVKYL